MQCCVIIVRPCVKVFVQKGHLLHVFQSLSLSNCNLIMASDFVYNKSKVEGCIISYCHLLPLSWLQMGSKSGQWLFLDEDAISAMFKDTRRKKCCCSSYEEFSRPNGPVFPEKGSLPKRNLLLRRFETGGPPLLQLQALVL